MNFNYEQHDSEIYNYDCNESCRKLLLRVKEYIITAIRAKLITHKTKGEKCGGQIS